MSKLKQHITEMALQKLEENATKHKFTEADHQEFRKHLATVSDAADLTVSKLKGGKIHYNTDGLFNGKLTHMGDHVKDEDDEESVFHYKSIAHAGRNMALGLSMPIQSKDGKKEITPHDKEHPDHKEYMDTYHHTSPNKVTSIGR